MLGVWPALFAKLFWRVPVVATYGYDYAHFAHQEGLWWLMPFIKVTVWFGWQFSDRVIVTSTNHRPKASLIPNGVDVNLYKPVKRQIHRPVRLLTVGRLVHQKNQLNLLRAVAKIKFPVELCLVGRGPLKQKIFALAEKLKVKLKYIESVSHHDLAKVYQAADIFCLVSHHEGSPKALLEAMSCGLPCVVADKPYSRFIMTNMHDGLLIKNKPESIALGIKQLINQPDLAGRLSQAARQTILERFDNQIIIHKEMKLLTSLIQ